MRALRFRNITTAPDDPVDQWGVEGILAAVDRGSLPHWRRIADAVRQRVLAHARQSAEAAARAEVRRRLQVLDDRSGLTAAQFAQRLGTSASRMSTYLSGKVIPSAAVLVRSETVCKMAAGEHNKHPTDR